MRLALTTVVALVGFSLGLVGGDRASAQSATVSPAQQLADQYAPIAELKTQQGACDRAGEAFFPAPVEIVLGNPEVALKQATGKDSGSDPVIMMGPTAADLAGKDETYYLDFPGNPRHAGCTFESNFDRFVAQTQATPTTYVHLVVDPAQGQLILQYWFWYYFNDFNNTHESDWEMIQLVFAATSAEEALGHSPRWVGYAQHGGGETADWTDDKLAKDGDHVIVHPAAGSHATYYGQATYIGWGENGTGFGCDHTTAPTTRTPLTAVVVPATPDPAGPFAWALFGGRWGERQPSEWNGPKGPNLGLKWSDPIAATENWRTSSLKVPASNAIGPNATDLFCSLSKRGSRLVTALISRPWLVVATFLAIIGLIIALFVVKRHELAEAFGIYTRHAGVFVGIGLFTIPIGIAFNEVQFLVRENPPVEWVMKWLNDTARARLTAAVAVGGLQQVAMILLVAPPVIQAVKDVRAGTPPGVARSFRLGYARLGSLAVALALIVVVLGALALLVIGLPVALWLAVRWQFFGQATIFDDVPTGRAALRRSRAVVHGRWWQALGDSLVFQIFAILPGPFVAALLMLMGKTTVDFANASSSIVYALTVPIAVIGLSLAFLRYQYWQTMPSAAPPSSPPSGGGLAAAPTPQAPSSPPSPLP